MTYNVFSGTLNLTQSVILCFIKGLRVLTNFSVTLSIIYFTRVWPLWLL